MCKDFEVFLVEFVGVFYVILLYIVLGTWLGCVIFEEYCLKYYGLDERLLYVELECFYYLYGKFFFIMVYLYRFLLFF